MDGKLIVWLRPLARGSTKGELDGQLRRVAVPGEFVLSHVFMDEYQVPLDGVPRGLYVKDATYGGASVLHEPMRVGSALGGTLRIIMGRDGGTVGVKVADKDGNPVADIDVYVLPANAPSEALVPAVTVRSQTDPSGSYTSGVLAPGKYYVLASRVRVDATPESAGKLWRSRSRGKEVALGPNGSLQATVEPVAIE